MSRDSLSLAGDLRGVTIGHFPGVVEIAIVFSQVFWRQTPLDLGPVFSGLLFLSIGILINSITQITQARLIQLRWLSVLAMMAAALLSPKILGSSSLMPRLLAFATFIAAINICLQLAAFFYRSDSNGFPMFSPLIQLFIDLVSWASYVYLSGGATNPLISVFLPLVAIGAIVLSKVQAWLFGIAAIICYSFLWRFYLPLTITDAETAARLHLLGMWLVFVVSAIVVIWFIQQMTRAIQQRDTALAEAREQAIRNDWLISVGTLAASAAHELSTPLATMRIIVDEWIEDASLSPTQRGDCHLLDAKIETCKQALGQLTLRAGHARGGSGEQVMAGPWLAGVLGAWSALNPAASMQLSLPAELDRCALPFDVTLERALSNLLDNAIRAGARQIQLAAEVRNRRLTLRIDDDGSGIPDAALQAYAAGQPSLSQNGMGIGLLLSRTAVERHGGHLALRRLVPRGTRVDIEIPLEMNGDECANES